MQEGFDKYLEHIFQFTPLREGRLWPVERDCVALPHFNSRPCERGDRNWAETSS